MNRLLFLLTFLLGMAVHAQQTVEISKEEALNKVAAQNTALKISQEEFNSAKADYRQTNAVFLPNIAVSHTGIATTNPLMAFGSKLNQEILTQADFNPSLLNDPSQIENYATRLEFQQPLINIDGFYQRKAAKTKMEAVGFQASRTKDFMAFEVDKAYMQLQLAHKAVDVLQKALNAAEANLTMANNSFKQGYLLRADVLAVEVRVTEVKNQLQSTQSNVRNASDYLSFLMNENNDVILLPKDSLAVISNSVDDIAEVSINRSDIRAMQLATDAYKNNLTADKMAFLPRLNAFGSYELYDDEIFQADASGYLFGASLSWNLLEGTKRFGKAKKSKAEYEKAKLELDQYVSQSQLELNKGKRMLQDAEKKLVLSELALQQSEESLRIRTNRYKEGLEKTADLLVNEAQYSQKQLDYFQTIFEYNYAQAYLQFLTKE